MREPPPEPRLHPALTFCLVLLLALATGFLGELLISRIY